MNKSKQQIDEWLSKLERESWQLELLVSAFTIFLLIGALSAYNEFIVDIQYRYNVNSMLIIIYFFLILLKNSLLALIISLVVHLSLRGFWIGAIGLRSVQSNVDFGQLNYNEFFTDKLKKRLVSLDQLVVKLDEICSVIFAFSFLVISILLAFGTYSVFLGLVGIIFSFPLQLLSGVFSTVFFFIAVTAILITLISGFIYMVDYFTLGFFKKIKWFSRIYYPFYKLYSFITFSALSRSIYYYLISKFSKTKIRLVYAVVGSIVMLLFLLEFDQHNYFPEESNKYMFSNNYYDNQRASDEYVSKISIKSNFVDQTYFQIFLRYDPQDNDLIRNNCPDFTPMKSEGLNWKFTTKSEGSNFQIQTIEYSDEDFQQLLICQSSIYQILVNDSTYKDLNYYFYEHPAKSQKGLLTTISTESFKPGENVLEVKKVEIDSVGGVSSTDYAMVPFWYSGE